jgi:hypothetical protein
MFSATDMLAKSERSCHITDTPPKGVNRRDRVQFFVEDFDEVSGVGLIDAGHDLDQSRLAGAVFASKAMHFAGTHVEVDSVERLDAPEMLADALQSQGKPVGPGARHHVVPRAGAAGA